MLFTSLFTRSSAVSGNYSFEADRGTDLDRLYQSLERKLQLAYAIGNREQIRNLEAEVESLTGWRFSRQRALQTVSRDAA